MAISALRIKRAVWPWRASTACESQVKTPKSGSVKPNMFQAWEKLLSHQASLIVGSYDQHQR